MKLDIEKVCKEIERLKIRTPDFRSHSENHAYRQGAVMAKKEIIAMLKNLQNKS